MSDELSYWRDVPMDVDLGAFSYITDHWNESVIVVSMNDFSEERKKCGW